MAIRTKPYAPIFSNTPARTAEPAAGASVWAGGSQVWNGTVGVLTAKPTRIAASTSPPASGSPASGGAATSSGMSKVWGAENTYSPMKPSSRASDPRNV